jgi:hypothetical protein
MIFDLSNFDRFIIVNISKFEMIFSFPGPGAGVKEDPA